MAKAYPIVPVRCGKSPSLVNVCGVATRLQPRKRRVNPIDRWKTDQAELRTASLALLDLVNQPAPPQAVLIAARWRVARALLRYLPMVDRIVYARLRLHRDHAAVAAVARFSTEAQAIYAHYERHSERWTPEAALADWPAYRMAVRGQAVKVQDRLDRELRELLPYLATAPAIEPVRAPTDRNWAGDGWRFRDLLGLDAPVPV